MKYSLFLVLLMFSFGLSSCLSNHPVVSTVKGCYDSGGHVEVYVNPTTHALGIQCVNNK